MITPRTAWVVLLISILLGPTATFPTTSGFSTTSGFPTTSAIFITAGPGCGCYQSASTSSTSFPVGNGPFGCTGCAVYAGTGSQTSQADSDVVVTAYSILSASGREPACHGVIGVPYTLPDPYTVTIPTSVLDLPTTGVQTYITNQILSSLGALGCADKEQNMVTSPTFLPAITSSTTSLITTSSASLPATSSSTKSLITTSSASLPATASSTTSPTPHSSSTTKPVVSPRLDEPAKIGIGAGVSLAALFLVSLVAFIWRKRRLRSAAVNAEEQGNTENRQEGTSASRGDSQPYLQQKAELEAEERQRHELEARQRVHELSGETGMIEIPAGEYEQQLAVMRSRQGLRGGEHSHKFDT